MRECVIRDVLKTIKTQNTNSRTLEYLCGNYDARVVIHDNDENNDVKFMT